MAYINPKTNKRSGSTTWTPEVSKVSAGRSAGAASPKASSRWSRLTRRDARTPLTVTIRYRGGKEAWFYVEARGHSGAFPGYRSLYDVMAEINEGKSRYVD